ncbi:hypothetical protein AAG570_006090 [Ranatra chinensis]|uniref:Uncharacterized protein n=1 Tax=Ranatra chinensis TaxID=642074 RepID=A0ABD0XYT2_9HEMI
MAQQQQYVTPVPILKQINRHNDDGSYSYGYENADGTFKIETKYPTGEVYGKYGYVDDTGAIREVEYGASKRGFEPAGNDINVAPPTLTVDSNNRYTGPDQYDDGQYREDPTVYHKNPEYNRPRNQQQQQTWRQPVYNPPPQQNYQLQPQQSYQPQPQQYYQPQPQPQRQQYYQPQQDYYQPRTNFNPNDYLNPAQFATHPSVSGVDIFAGSYSVNYK